MYIVLLCGQKFCSNLKANSKVILITIHSIKYLLKQFYHDAYITIEADHDSLLELERLFDRKAAQSGLKINYNKTEVLLRVGLLRNTDLKIIMSQEK